jgi:hypothetical protein
MLQFVTANGSISATGHVTFDSRIDILYTASRFMEQYLQPVIVLLGVVGNILSFRILSLPNYKNQTTCVYMKGMAISDSMYLVLYALQRTVISYKNKELRAFDGFRWVCNQFLFWSYYSALASAVLLEVMSMERLFVMLFPFRSRAWCSVKISKRFVIGLFVFLLFLLPTNMLRERQARIDGWLCPFHFNENMAAVYDYFFSICDVYIPFCILSLCNVGIIMVLKISEERRQDMAVDESKAKSSKHIVRMLITVSLAYLVFKLPYTVRSAIWNASITGEITPLLMAYQRFTVSLSEILEYSNYAFNTYLYILSVKKFRQDARRILCRTKGEN